MNTLSRLFAPRSKPVRADIFVDERFQNESSSVRSGIVKQETADELNREPREPRENQELDHAEDRPHVFARCRRDAFWGKPSPFAYFGCFAVPSLLLTRIPKWNSRERTQRTQRKADAEGRVGKEADRNKSTEPHDAFAFFAFFCGQLRNSGLRMAVALLALSTLNLQLSTLNSPLPTI